MLERTFLLFNNAASYLQTLRRYLFFPKLICFYRVGKEFDLNLLSTLVQLFGNFNFTILSIAILRFHIDDFTKNQIHIYHI
jgi:hypothetical protein